MKPSPFNEDPKKTINNKKLIAALKKNKKSVYGLSKVLGVSVSNSQRIVKDQNLTKLYNRLKLIAEYADDSMENLFGPKKDKE